ncbi:MAG: hypothetical protein ACI92S_001992, partial [Planctomycetaceae bacterium]
KARYPNPDARDFNAARRGSASSELIELSSRIMADNSPCRLNHFLPPASAGGVSKRTD